MKYKTEEMLSFKKMMSLRKNNSNELIKDFIGYDPEKICLENIRRAEQRWTDIKSHNQCNDEPIKYTRRTSNTFINGIIIFCILSVISQHNYNTK